MSEYTGAKNRHQQYEEQVAELPHDTTWRQPDTLLNLQNAQRAAIIAERDALRLQVAALVAERDALREVVAELRIYGATCDRTGCQNKPTAYRVLSGGAVHLCAEHAGEIGGKHEQL